MRADSPLVAEISASPNFDDRKGKAVQAIVLHYTGMATGEVARARLLDPAAEVSCHYLVWDDGRTEQLVAESDRAWHAGRSYWAGETDLNAVSIGIEIVNGGHDGGCPPYPDAQILAVIALCQDVVRRRALDPRRILAHSDVAPDRKQDPGEWFPWERLAAEGLGLWIDPAILAVVEEAMPDATMSDAACAESGGIAEAQANLVALGYRCPLSSIADRETAEVVAAFQRHFRPDRVDGVADRDTRVRLKALGGVRP